MASRGNHKLGFCIARAFELGGTSVRPGNKALAYAMKLMLSTQI